MTWHYLVSVRMWRGIPRQQGAGVRAAYIRRACDWKPCSRLAGLLAGPKCPDCVAYVEALNRLGVRIFQ